MKLQDPKLPFTASQIVNKIGKYLYKNIDSAYKFKTSSNMIDVYMYVYYQLPYWDRIPGKGPEYNELHEIKLDINITTYQNRIRVNIIEITEYEKTLGHYVFTPDQLVDMEKAKKAVLKTIVTVLSKVYEDYDFIF